MSFNLADLSAAEWIGIIVLAALIIFTIIYAAIHRKEIAQEWKSGKWPAEYPRIEANRALVAYLACIIQKFKK